MGKKEEMEKLLEWFNLINEIISEEEKELENENIFEDDLKELEEIDLEEFWLKEEKDVEEKEDEK